MPAVVVHDANVLDSLATDAPGAAVPSDNPGFCDDLVGLAVGGSCCRTCNNWHAIELAMPQPRLLPHG
ncbi:MAG: hypothetical protein LBS56_01085 [Propionibacteriaceae bacterium]|jgi:hypothetical protein|nr:hypothetical protein [Propionibacteriaceae bacterium]